ncbi:MAG: regulatory iron-sulfur-containing complex subunit RicT [Phycisphaerae bacterium]|nr:regulatory iron-sulfur-containing complex subunit RicT [Phycisphaerae bacterium]
MSNINEPQKHKHSPSEKKMLVRYGKFGTVGWFAHNETSMPKSHSKVMIKTERGLEIGEVVGRFCYKAGAFKKSEEAVIDYYDQGVEECPVTTGGRFVRYATDQDLAEERHINSNAKGELKKCMELIRDMNLPMKLVDIEHIFGGERIIFYFTSETRVDFRELVKNLAREFQTRIEMRQVGSRDAAKIAADVEVCGQVCCCARYLKILKPVNMKMAKLQKATLDPSKISGYCGRLKCCLRYEDHTYRDLSRRLPRKRTRVKTPHGEGFVIEGQILTQLVKIKADDGTVFAVPVEEIEILQQPTQPEKPKQAPSNRSPGSGRQDNNNDADSEDADFPDEGQHFDDAEPDKSDIDDAPDDMEQ